LNDSVASIGLQEGTSKSDELDRAVTNGPRQLFQPKICMSILKASSVPPSGKAVWVDDTPNELRVSQWASLLKSQQQHAIMSKAQFLQSSQNQ